MRNIAIVTNTIKDSGRKLAKKVISILKELDDNIETVLMDMDKVDTSMLKDAECILVLGGDGTLLSVAKDTIKLGKPLLGINLGDIGFLAEVEKKNIRKALTSLVADNYHIEERMMLSGEVVKSGKSSKKISALNDIVLSRRGDMQVVGYRVTVNGLYLTDFYADGIILSTPTGSTGYNMSAGGSIVEPKARLILLTPVSPHTLSTRSIVLSDSDRVEVEILPPKGSRPTEVGVYFDGYGDDKLSAGDRVVITKASKVTRLCKLSDMSFLDVLHKKMNSGT